MAKKGLEDDSLLSNFEFDTPNVNDFFGVTGSAIETVPASKKKVDDVDNVDDNDDIENDDDDKLTDDDFTFTLKDDSEVTEKQTDEDGKTEDKSKNKKSKKEKEESSDKPDDVNDSSVFGDLTKDLKELGVFSSVDFGEDEEVTSDVFFEKFEEEVSNRAENIIQGLMSNLDDDAATFLKFKSQGGSTEEFFRLYGQVSELPVSNVDSAENQEAFLRYYYATEEELDSDDIDDRITAFTESGKLERYAKKYFSKVEQQYANERDSLLKQQEDFKKQQVENQKQFRINLKNIISTEKELGDLTLDPKKDIHLVDFITKPIYDKETKSNITGFQKKMAEVFNDEKKLLLLAKLVASDFDLSSVKKKGETTANIKTLNTLRTKREMHANSRKNENKSLADYFN